MYVSLWWSMRLYVLLFAGFIAAFGAFRWRLPGHRQHYEQIGRGDVNQRDDASAADPNYRPYRLDAPLHTSNPVRP